MPVNLKKQEANTFQRDGRGNITSKIRWVSHNKCRNPGNSKGAPWCYTKNPNVRWQYCTKPDYSQVIARSVLLITFLFCFILAYAWQSKQYSEENCFLLSLLD